MTAPITIHLTLTVTPDLAPFFAGLLPKAKVRPPRVTPITTWTPERCALLDKLWPVGVPLDDIVEQLRALPGNPPTRFGTQAQACKRGLRRGVLLNIGRPVGRETVWTPARLEVLKKEYPGGINLDVLLEKINALPGSAPVVRGGLAPKARKCGLNRLVPQTGQYKRKPKPPAPPPVACPAAPPPPPPVSWKPDAPVAAEYVPAPPAAISFGYPVEASGKQPATFAEVQAWAAGRRCHFDGSNMEAVNRLLQMMRLPLLVVVS